MQRALLLHIVIGQRTPILQLLAGENQTLLIRWNALLILDLCLHLLDRIAGLHVESNRLSRERLDKNLHL